MNTDVKRAFSVGDWVSIQTLNPEHQLNGKRGILLQKTAKWLIVQVHDKAYNVDPRLAIRVTAPFGKFDVSFKHEGNDDDSGAPYGQVYVRDIASCPDALASLPHPGMHDMGWMSLKHAKAIAKAYGIILEQF